MWAEESKHNNYFSLKSRGNSIVSYVRDFKDSFMLIKLIIHCRIPFRIIEVLSYRKDFSCPVALLAVNFNLKLL